MINAMNMINTAQSQCNGHLKSLGSLIYSYRYLTLPLHQNYFSVLPYYVFAAEQLTMFTKYGDWSSEEWSAKAESGKGFLCPFPENYIFL